MPSSSSSGWVRAGISRGRPFPLAASTVIPHPAEDPSRVELRQRPCSCAKRYHASGAASGKSESASGRAAGVDVLTSREEASKLEASSTRNILITSSGRNGSFQFAGISVMLLYTMM